MQGCLQGFNAALESYLGKEGRGGGVTAHLHSLPKPRETYLVKGIEVCHRI